MSFVSFTFLILFLPTVLLLYFYMRKKEKHGAAKAVLAVSSAFFYAFYGLQPFVILCAVLLADWGLTIALRKTQDKKNKRLLLASGIILNVLLLMYFKYSAFFADNIAALLGTPKLSGFDRIIAPAGISYYTFCQIAWLADSYKGETVKYGFLDYAVSVLFFPKIGMGPIMLHGELLPQLDDKKKFSPDAEAIGRGLIFIAVGLAKKTILEPLFAGPADFGFDSEAVSMLSVSEAWLCSVAYTIQLYLDFSGYCDMAYGMSKMFNIELVKNFDMPYKAVSISDFWKRWHISLTAFLRKYIYFPLGGSRKGSFRTCLNIMIIFIISGFWHGADWSFVLWGALHGFVMVLERLAGERLSKIPAIIRRAVTLFIVNAGWVLFRSGSVSAALVMFKHMFVTAPGTSVFALSPQFYASFGMESLYFISAHLNIAVFLPFAAVLLTTAFVKKDIYSMELKPGKLTAVLTALLLAFSVFATGNVTNFIYSGF